MGQYIPFQAGNPKHTFGRADAGIDQGYVVVGGISVQAVQPIPYQSRPFIARCGYCPRGNGIAKGYQGYGISVFSFRQDRGDCRPVIVRAGVDQGAGIGFLHRCVILRGIDFRQFFGHADMVDTGGGGASQADDHTHTVDPGDIESG